MPILSVEAIVAVRDKQPYVIITKDGQRVGQLTIAQARSFAADVVTMAARAEAAPCLQAPRCDLRRGHGSSR